MSEKVDRKKLVDDPFTAFRKAIIKAGKRHMETYVNMSYGAEPEANPAWTPRRKKVWKDSQLPTKEAPTYLKAAQDFAEGFQRAEAERQAPVRLGIVMLGGVKDLESWQQEAKQIEEEPQRLAIEAQVIEDKK